MTDESLGQCVVLQDEVQLLGYGETDSGGPWLKFRLQDPAQLGPFRGHAKATANKCGQRYALVLVEIGDDEKPVKQESKKTDTNYAFQCAQLFDHELFTAYMSDKHDLDRILAFTMESDSLAMWYESDNPVEEYPAMMLEACVRQAKKDIGIERKRELNQNHLALMRFKEFQQSFYKYVRAYNSLGDFGESDLPAHSA